MLSFPSSTLARVAWCQIAFKIIAHFDGVVGCLHWKNPFLNMCIEHFFCLSAVTCIFMGLIATLDGVVEYLHWKKNPSSISALSYKSSGVLVLADQKKSPRQYVHCAFSYKPVYCHFTVHPH